MRLDGVGALHVAAAGASLEVCTYMVEGLGVDVDAVDDDGAFLTRGLDFSVRISCWAGHMFPSIELLAISNLFWLSDSIGN